VLSLLVNIEHRSDEVPPNVVATAAETGEQSQARAGAAAQAAAGSLADAWSTTTPELPPATEPPANHDLLAEARSRTLAPAAAPGDTTVSTTAVPAPADDDQAMGLRQAAEHHPPGITLAELRFARANDPAFLGSVDERGTELFYRVGDLRKWACSRPVPPPADLGPVLSCDQGVRCLFR
jgi:hypothetical protein